MYLKRNDPRGPHNEAIKFLLRSRGDGQLYSPTRFSLWRLAHYRLQSWQTLFREQPDAQQVEWMSKLNTDRPDLRICSNVLQMNVLSAAAKVLSQKPLGNEQSQAEDLARAMQLTQEMQDLNASMELWASDITGPWKGTTDDTQIITDPQDADEAPEFPIPKFPYPHLLSYDDIWLV